MLVCAGTIINTPGSGNFLLTSGHCYTGELMGSPPGLLSINVQLRGLLLTMSLCFDGPVRFSWVAFPSSYCCGCADKSALQDFHFWLVIFNYEAPCGSIEAPLLQHVVQVIPASQGSACSSCSQMCDRGVSNACPGQGLCSFGCAEQRG